MHFGQWINFLDLDGKGWAQPDALVVSDHLVWIFETKLTHTEDAAKQLRGLYVPLVKHVWPDKGTIAMEVCHNIGPAYRAHLWHRVFEFGGALEKDAELYLYHWLG